MGKTKRLVEELSWEQVDALMEEFFNQQEEEMYRKQDEALDGLSKEQTETINYLKQD